MTEQEKKDSYSEQDLRDMGIVFEKAKFEYSTALTKLVEPTGKATVETEVPVPANYDQCVAVAEYLGVDIDIIVSKALGQALKREAVKIAKERYTRNIAKLVRQTQTAN